MGYKFTEKVYSEVKGTTPPQQAVLAYIAHRTIDETGLPAFHFSIDRIAKETHYGTSTINNALSELKKLGLIVWKSGGRQKGNGGKAFTNEYYLHLSTVVNKNPPQDASIVQEVDNAVSTRRIMQYPPDGQCIVQEMDTIHRYINNNKLVGHKGGTSDGNFKSLDIDNQLPTMLANVGKAYRKQLRLERGNEQSCNPLDSPSPVARALAICNVNDLDNRRIFNVTMMRVGMKNSMMVVNQFIDEIKSGQHKTLDSKGRCCVLMSRLKSFLPLK